MDPVTGEDEDDFCFQCNLQLHVTHCLDIWGRQPELFASKASPSLTDSLTDLNFWQWCYRGLSRIVQQQDGHLAKYLVL